MLNIICTECHVRALDADCHYAECHIRALDADCHYAECHYAECHYGDCRQAECHCAECHYAECHYAECCGAIQKAKVKKVLLDWFSRSILYSTEMPPNFHKTIINTERHLKCIQVIDLDDNFHVFSVFY
jgi:hypothetical protein